jgi:Rhodopsin-like GPCR transmembrane domain
MLSVPSIALGRVFSGVMDGSVGSQYLGKFAFASDPSGSPVGNFQLQYMTSQTSLSFYEFDDSDLASSYGKDCLSFISGATNNIALIASPNSYTTVTGTFIESIRPHYWYFYGANNVGTAPGDCVPAASGEYILTVTQANGSQLGYDEIGMPAIYGVFWFFSFMILCFHLYGHYFRTPRFGPTIVICFTLVLFLHSGSTFCNLINWSVVQSSGKEVPFMEGVAAMLRFSSLFLIYVLSTLSANGYGITSYSLKSQYNIIGFIAVIFVAILLFVVLIWYWATVNRVAPPVTTFVAALPAISILALTLIFLGWFIFAIRSTIFQETHTTKRTLLFRLSFALGSVFMSLPLSEFIASVTPVYERTRVLAGIDLFIITCIYGALTWILWPTNAGPAFKVFDGSSALFLEANGEGTDVSSLLATPSDDFSASLDAAYAAMKDGEGSGVAPVI